jgi:hypothetical protein
LPRHATVLKDRGSAENSVGSSDPSAGVENVESNYGSRGITSGSNHSKLSPSSMSKGSRGASQSSNKHSTAPAAKSQPKDVRSHTPVRDHIMEVSESVAHSCMILLCLRYLCELVR